MERNKWHAENVPESYPFLPKDKIEEVLKDLEYEYHQKLRFGKNNPIWEKLIKNHMDSGRQQIEILSRGQHWFSMNNPIVYILVLVVIAVGSYLASEFDLLQRIF